MEQTVNLLRPKGASGVQIPLSAPFGKTQGKLMKTKEEIKSFLQNEPLIEAALCSDAIEALARTDPTGTSLFFGIGLCTAKEPAVAIPFDILSFFLVAERLRQFLGMARVVVLIADTHALTNNFMTPDIVHTLTQKSFRILTFIIRNLKLKGFELLIHSDISAKKIFTKTLESIPAMNNQYLRHEIADITWLTKHKHIALKLGWTIDSCPVPGGHDERFFDTELLKLAPLPINFLYLKAGRTFDKHRQKVSPYISVAGEPRIIIDPHEDVRGKFSAAHTSWEDDHFGGTRRHVADIVRLFEKLFGQLPSLSLEQKIEHIIKRITKEETL